MIFQRGNPLDYERWAADAGHGELGLRALPAVLQADGELPGGRRRRPFRGDDGPLVLERGPADQPAVPGASSRRCSRPATRSPTTSTATGRRASRRSTATSTAAAGFSAARAYLHPVMNRPNLRVHDARLRHARSCSRAPARSASSSRQTRPRPQRPRAAAPRSSSAAARSTRRSCCSCPASATPSTGGARHRRRRTTCPASARTCRTTSRCTSSTAATQPVSWRPR